MIGSCAPRGVPGRRACAIGRLAAAVLLDAFILRTLLVPALMHLFSGPNWWLPGWLDRALPRLSIEPATEPPARPSPAPARELTRNTTAR